jgi:type II restriction enzyme
MVDQPRRMDLQARAELGESLRSRSQIARVVTEDWCAREMYCPGCDSEKLTKAKTGSPTCDFTCIACKERFELKSGRHPFGSRIPDSAYGAMMAAIREDRTPNLLAVQYSAAFTVTNLFLIPRYFIVESVIEKRPPLGIYARRAGWVGCNILLSRIPIDGRIAIVDEGIAAPADNVRMLFQKARRLKNLPVMNRGWTVDVLNALRTLRKPDFTLADVYAYERHFAEQHANNRNIRPKIRQQLQVLRDLGFVEFVERGRYRLVSDGEVYRP